MPELQTTGGEGGSHPQSAKFVSKTLAHHRLTAAASEFDELKMDVSDGRPI
jgi:hypothetical protein